MPLQDEKTDQVYVKITKIYINSDERDDGNIYSYRIKLNEEIQYVAGMELTSYNLPIGVAPSFLDTSNKLDFSITDGGNTSSFSVEFATIPMDYVDGGVDNAYRSYVDQVETLINDAVDSDPVFGTAGYNCAVTVNSNTNFTTNIEFADGGFDATTFTLNFETGPNNARSAYKIMGFEKQDYSAFSGNTITSPNQANMQSYRFVDINIEEARELRPLSRIYMNTNSYEGVTVNETNITRTRLLSSDPIRSLRYLTVKITLEGGVSPPITGQDPHDLGLTIFSVANENSVPNWVTQTFIL